MQAAGADAVGAALVFLDLLKGQPDGFAQLFLAHAQQGAAQAQTATDIDVDGMGVPDARAADNAAGF